MSGMCRRAVITLAVVAGTAAVVGCTGHPAAKRSHSPGPTWSAVHIAAQRTLFGVPQTAGTVGQQYAFAGSTLIAEDTENVVAYDLASGRQKWHVNAFDESTRISPLPASSGGRVAVSDAQHGAVLGVTCHPVATPVTQGCVGGLSAATGTFTWQTRVPLDPANLEINSTPVTTSAAILVPFIDTNGRRTKLAGLDPTDGRVLWTLPGAQLASARPGPAPSSTAIIRYTGAHPTLTAIDVRTGRALWAAPRTDQPDVQAANDQSVILQRTDNRSLAPYWEVVNTRTGAVASAGHSDHRGSMSCAADAADVACLITTIDDSVTPVHVSVLSRAGAAAVKITASARAPATTEIVLIPTTRAHLILAGTLALDFDGRVAGSLPGPAVGAVSDRYAVRTSTTSAAVVTYTVSA